MVQTDLVLASQSTARAQLMRDAGLMFSIQPAHVDEAAIKIAAQNDGLPVDEIALRLASAKAQHVALQMPDALVIGSDQILICEDRLFDKPQSLQDARVQLQFLRSKTHRLVTAITCHQHGACVWQHVAQPQLVMRDFSDAFLDVYLTLEAQHILHCVGAYRLEGPGVQLFAQIDGAYSDILGLPLLPLLEFLRQHGILQG